MASDSFARVTMPNSLSNFKSHRQARIRIPLSLAGTCKDPGRDPFLSKTVAPAKFRACLFHNPREQIYLRRLERIIALTRSFPERGIRRLR